MKKYEFFLVLVAITICSAQSYAATLTQQSTPTGISVFVTGSTVAGNGSVSISSAPSAARTVVPNIFINNTNGNVGIKTAAPAYDLDVNGQINASGSVGYPSKTIAQLNAITPGAKGQHYHCTDCSPEKDVVSTGTSVANFSDTVGGSFK